MTFEEACQILGGPMEPDRDELRNHWTVQTLTCYHAERHLSASDKLLNPPTPKPSTTVNALKWL